MPFENATAMIGLAGTGKGKATKRSAKEQLCLAMNGSAKA